MDNNNLNPSPEQENSGEQEIDLLELASKLWDRRRLIIRWVIAGIVVGIVVAFSIPREYTSTVKLSPELNNKPGANGSLNALASFAGVNLGSGNTTDAVYPELYPDVVSSIPFTVALLDIPLQTKKGIYTVQEYLEDEISAPWWSYITSLPFKAIGAVRSIFDDEIQTTDSINPFNLTPGQHALVKSLSTRIGADVNTKNSVVTISATMQDPHAAAQLADSVMTRLQKHIINYRTEKSRCDLEYSRKINEEARQEYYKAQQVYAAAADRNQSLSSRSASIELERLQNEASLAFSLYNSTAQNVKMAEAKVQETTPVFAVVQPATVPVEPSKPSKAMILIGFVFLFFVAACAYILYFPSLINTIKKKKQTKAGEEIE